MKRTEIVAAGLTVLFAGSGIAQEPAAPPVDAPVAATDPVDTLVRTMRDAEQALTSLRLTMRTEGRLPGGLTVKTRGTLHVLRGTQSVTRTSVEYEFADGLRGRVEAAETKEGITMFESDPTFGEVFLHLDAAVVADLAWAGEVLERSDLPGMRDARAMAPLGSAMVADLQRHFVLQPTNRTERGGEAGVWLLGRRKPGLDLDDPDLPMADQVELFVRSADHALLEVVHKQGEVVVQQLVVEALATGIDVAPKLLQVDGGGLKVREVQQHRPLWEQIEKVLKQAEAKSKDGVGRPSRR